MANAATLSLRSAANYCEILVDDEGPGIPEDKRDEVFRPFNRLDPSRNPKTGGVGLGLTIARDIALRAWRQHFARRFARAGPARHHQVAAMIEIINMQKFIYVL